MPRGGARPGSGRKPGVKSKLIANAIALAEKEGGSPLQFLLATMNNRRLPISTRLAAATAAAPYVHPRLSAALHASMPTTPGTDARQRLDAMLARLSSPSPLIELPAVAVDAGGAKEVTVVEPQS